MLVGYNIDYSWYEIGKSDFLHSFFSTICYCLENEQWGSKYPYLMKNLYQGNLSYKDVNDAIHELQDVREKLKDFSLDKVIWDIEDLSKQPPWGENISKYITSLSNYFMTSDGEDLIDVTFKALENVIEIKQDIRIRSM